MKKILISGLVGGVILLIWQTLSWTALDIHGEMQAYTPNQDAVMEFLGENLEEGFYYMPNVVPGSNENPMEAFEGKPWAQVYYHNAYSADMGTNMARGFAVNFLAVLLLAWVLLKMDMPSFSTILTASIAVGFIGYLTVTYTNSIWFETKTMGDLVDTLVSWALVGLWLGWWLRK